MVITGTLSEKKSSISHCFKERNHLKLFSRTEICIFAQSFTEFRVIATVILFLEYFRKSALTRVKTVPLPCFECLFRPFGRWSYIYDIFVLAAMGKFMKSGKVVLILGGRFAGRKAVIVKVSTEIIGSFRVRTYLYLLIIIKSPTRLGNINSIVKNQAFFSHWVLSGARSNKRPKCCKIFWM